MVASCLLPPLARLLGVFIVTRASEPVLGPGARGQRPEAWAPHVPAGRAPRGPRRLAPQALRPGRARAGEGQCAGEGAAVHRGGEQGLMPRARYFSQPSREREVESSQQVPVSPP